MSSGPKGDGRGTDKVSQGTSRPLHRAGQRRQGAIEPGACERVCVCACVRACGGQVIGEKSTRVCLANSRESAANVRKEYAFKVGPGQVEGAGMEPPTLHPCIAKFRVTTTLPTARETRPGVPRESGAWEAAMRWQSA